MLRVGISNSASSGDAAASQKYWVACGDSPAELAAKCIQTIEVWHSTKQHSYALLLILVLMLMLLLLLLIKVQTAEQFTAEWQRLHYEALNFASFSLNGPQWR